MKSPGTIRFLRIMLAIILLAASSVVADSWLPASEQTYRSENGQYQARMIPATKKAACQLIVYSILPGKTNEIWRAKLNNTYAPCEIMLEDDGKAAVTLDNWGSVGYGDNVVAIYSSGGLLAKYSLEQFAPLPKSTSKTPADIFAIHSISSDDGTYREFFTHSTSSRHWQENGLLLFHSATNLPLFCVWLDWDNRWVAWRLDNGSLINTSLSLTEQLNQEGRRRALRQAKSKDVTEADLNFLGRMRHTEDRTLIENWLHSTDFSLGYMSSGDTTTRSNYFAFMSSSYKRAAADRILTRWDQPESRPGNHLMDAPYHQLGTLKCIVNLLKPPKSKDGVLRLYLIPSSVSLNQWANAAPEHYLVASLKEAYPFTSNGNWNSSGGFSAHPNFIISGITPGQYWLKAIWQKHADATEATKLLSEPQPGDYESVASPTVTIDKGQVVEGIHIECKTLVMR